MSLPLVELYREGDTIDFTREHIGRVCNQRKDKIRECPHCHRNGMYVPLISNKVRFVHQGVVNQQATQHLKITDSCEMWPRTEYRLRYGYDGIHPKYRYPGDEQDAVEEVRPTLRAKATTE